MLWWCSIHSITKCPKCLSLENSFCFSKIIALNRKREDSAFLVLLFLTKWWSHHILAINWTGLHQHGWFLHWKDWCWSWNSNTLVTWCEELTHLKRPWCWERLRAGGHRDNRGWDGWMASPTQWTWVLVDSGSWWRTGRPGMLRFMVSRRVGHYWATELNINVGNPRCIIINELSNWGCLLVI